MWYELSALEDLSGATGITVDTLEDIFQDLACLALEIDDEKHLKLLLFLRLLSYFNDSSKEVPFSDIIFDGHELFVESSLFFGIYCSHLPGILAKKSRFSGSASYVMEDAIRRLLQSRMPLPFEKYKKLYYLTDQTVYKETMQQARILLRFFVSVWLEDFELSFLSPDRYIEIYESVIPSSLSQGVGRCVGKDDEKNKNLKETKTVELNTDLSQMVLNAFLTFWMLRS